MDRLDVYKRQGIISIQITAISKAEGNYAVHLAVIQNRIHKEAI